MENIRVKPTKKVEVEEKKPDIISTEKSFTLPKPSIKVGEYPSDIISVEGLIKRGRLFIPQGMKDEHPKLAAMFSDLNDMIEVCGRSRDLAKMYEIKVKNMQLSINHYKIVNGITSNDHLRWVIGE